VWKVKTKKHMWVEMCMGEKKDSKKFVSEKKKKHMFTIFVVF
jgi:hypothetical protein